MLTAHVDSLYVYCKDITGERMVCKYEWRTCVIVIPTNFFKGAPTFVAMQVLAAYMQGCALFTPAVSIGFGLSHLETVLKSAMQAAGVEGQPSVLLIEDHHLTCDDILETVNSLLSAGE